MELSFLLWGFSVFLSISLMSFLSSIQQDKPFSGTSKIV